MSSNNKRTYGSPIEARQQAAELLGFLASTEIQVGNETVEIPCRGLFDDEQSERVAELELESETWDHHPDTVIDGVTMPGQLKRPYRKGGKLVRPEYRVRLAMAVLGKEEYERLHKLGLQASTVTALLNVMDQKLEDRALIDPKSMGSDSEPVPVPEPS